MSKKITAKNEYVAPRSVQADSHLVALLRFILGDNGDGDYRDVLITNAITAARHILKSQTSHVSINDELVGGNETLHHTLNGVREWLERPDRVMGDRKKVQLAALATLESSDDATALEGADLFSAISECADSGVLVGAAIMYGMLKGGVR